MFVAYFEPYIVQKDFWQEFHQLRAEEPVSGGDNGQVSVDLPV